ncbi:hypothetical protein HK096_001237, partial [Nowakowskiella sp. JEL0078]
MGNEISTTHRNGDREDIYVSVTSEVPKADKVLPNFANFANFSASETTVEAKNLDASLSTQNLMDLKKNELSSLKAQVSSGFEIEESSGHQTCANYHL